MPFSGSKQLSRSTDKDLTLDEALFTVTDSSHYLTFYSSTLLHLHGRANTNSQGLTIDWQ